MTITHLILGVLFLLMVDVIADWRFDHIQLEKENHYDFVINEVPRGE